MIASLHGSVLDVRAGHVVIEVGGVGVRAEITTACSQAMVVGSVTSLFTQLVVREDSLTLFGFVDADELEMFNLLNTVSGVGPRSALGILSELHPTEIAIAVKRDDDKPFRQVSGIGPKTAKLIVVSLAGKIDAFGYSNAVGAPVTSGNSNDQSIAIVQALVGLGWPEGAASDAVASAQRVEAELNDQELLRASLLQLQNKPGRR